MADPAIQTFCCHSPGKRVNPSLYVIMEFNTSYYNTVCLISSFVGIFGALYQILHKRDYHHKHRWLSLVCGRGRGIIMWLAVADLLASFGVFVRSIMKLNDYFVTKMDEDNLTFLFCMSFAAWIQYFYCVTWMWTLCYTVDMCLAVQDRPARPLLYHLFSWLIPAVLTAGGLFLLYYPDPNCIEPAPGETLLKRILPNYIATYLPMVSVMVANPLLYCYVAKYLRKMIWMGFAQWTNKEREVAYSVHRTFLMVNLLFYACWLPNVVSAMLAWLWSTPPVEVIVILWYIMAILNPLQAVFNCIIYTGFSAKMNVPWYPVDAVVEETTPLLSTNSSRDEDAKD